MWCLLFWACQNNLKNLRFNSCNCSLRPAILLNVVYCSEETGEKAEGEGGGVAEEGGGGEENVAEDPGRGRFG